MKRALFLPLYYTISCALLPFITTLFIPSVSPAPPIVSLDAEEDSISVFNHTDNTSLSMSMDEYLIGVVAAEMPASFETEALKAQAVAARTYTLFKQGSSDHSEDICTNPSHCQAYFTDSDMHLNWGDGYDTYLKKISDAVNSTSGEYLSYNSEPVMAVFHSMGGGKTENSADVWGSSVPYLVSVSSPGEEVASNYHSTQTFSFSEFKEKIIASYPNAKISSYLDISQPTLTGGDHVKSMIIGSVSIPGTELRRIFNLRSTKFTVSCQNDSVTFNVTGYGHGVGMSQYGANAMAKEGKTYKEILSHYYQGTNLTE